MNTADNNFQYPPNSIATYTGKVFDLSVMDPESIDIKDIARALSMNCRWGGHVKAFFSIAEHSIRVCEAVENPRYKLQALLHDASEAYLLDIPKPFKIMMPEYVALEDKLMNVIAEKYGFEYPLRPEVKFADKMMLEWEWYWLKDLRNQQTPSYMAPREAEKAFMKMYREIRFNERAIKAHTS